MDSIAQLAQQYFLLKMGVGHHQPSIDWALERLRLDQEGDDLDIVMLAAATSREEAAPLIEAILQTHLGISAIDDRFAAGKYIALLRTAYLDGKETIESLDEKFTKLYHKLEYPDWLVMLSRNCEYATDIPEFREPFEQEFEYVATLWAGATSPTDFESKYSRGVSNSHDVKYG
ncbi:hypothetical protein [Methyloversatilis sp.]|uniref:hypothetical protein n=1 Tax=Methyloversatilis sp. TaxID=2569862 RepID=UPI003D28A5E6